MRFFHKLQNIRSISEGKVLSLEHTFYQNPKSCWIKHDMYHFYLTRCKEYKFLEKIVIFGKVEEVVDKIFFQQKTLKVQSIFIFQNQSTSYKDWQILFLRPIIRARLFLLKKTHELWSNPYGSLIAGFVFGFKESLPEEFVKKIKITGMQHVVVASGFNISLVMLLCSNLVNVFTSQKLLKSSLVTLGIFIYGLISGLSPPLSRALIMAILSIGAKNLFFRQYRPLFGLLVAAIIMLMFKPLYFFDISFQLSTTATLGIILISPVINRSGGVFKSLSTNDLSQIELDQNTSKSFFGKLIDFFFDSFSTTLSAQIFTLPLLLYHFGEFSLVSLASNTFLLWLTPFITYAGFFVLIISAIFSFFPWMSSNLLQIISFSAWLPTYFFVEGVKFFGRFEAGYFNSIKFSIWWVLSSWFFVAVFIYLSKRSYEKA